MAKDSRVRILFLITDLDVGGAEKQLALLAPRLDRRAFDVRVVCLKPEGPVAARLRAEGVPVESLGWRHPLDPRPLLRLWRMLREFRPRILHTFLFHADLVGRFVGRLAGVSRILTSVRVAYPPGDLRVAPLRLTAFLVDGASCVSEPAAAFARRRLGFAWKPVGMIVNAAEPAISVSRPRRDGTFRVLTVGRLVDQKQMDGVIWGIDDTSLLTIAGEGPLRGFLECEASWIATDRVRFTGRCEDLGPLFLEAEAFVLYSSYEGMPNVVLEAMAYGVPVVVTEAASSGIVRDGETGWVVSEDSHSYALAKALREIRERPDEARRRAARALAWVREHHRVEDMVAKHEAFYRGMRREE